METKRPARPLWAFPLFVVSNPANVDDFHDDGARTEPLASSQTMSDNIFLAMAKRL